jgi:hypothetical protein
MATANITIGTNVESTALTLDPSGSGLKINSRIFNNYQHACTTANYATAIDAIATEIYNYIVTLGTSGTRVMDGYSPSYTGTGATGQPVYLTTPVLSNVGYIQVQITVANMQAPEYSTPRYYATQFRSGLTTPASDAVGVVAPSEIQQSFTLGPGDYSSQATLKAAYLAQLTTAINASGYS